MHGKYDPDATWIGKAFDVLDISLHGRNDFESGLSDNGESYFRTAEIGNNLLALAIGVTAAAIASGVTAEPNLKPPVPVKRWHSQFHFNWKGIVVCGLASFVLATLTTTLPLISVNTLLIAFVGVLTITCTIDWPTKWRHILLGALISCLSFLLLDWCLFTDLHPAFPDHLLFDKIYGWLVPEANSDTSQGTPFLILFSTPSLHEFQERCHAVSALLVGLLGGVIVANVTTKT